MRYSLLLLSFMMSGLVCAQNKLDVSLQQNLAQMGVSSKYAPSISHTSTMLPVFLYFTSPKATYTDAEIAALGGSVAARLDDMLLVRVPISALAILNQDDRVFAIEGDRKFSTKLAKAVQHDSVITWMTRGNTGTSYTPTQIGKLDGSGVLVGVVDNGFHMTSPAFLTADVANVTPEHLRIKGHWHYSPNKECTFYSGQSLINEQYDSRNGSHGTHVAAIAVGSPITLTRGGQPFTWSGIAPKADIVVSTGEVPNYLAEETSWWDVIAATNTIFHYADSVQQPCVINISLGCNIGRHDDTHPFAKAMKTLTNNQPGHIVCVASSNEADMKCSMQGTLQAADQQVRLEYDKPDQEYEYEIYNMSDTSALQPELIIWGEDEEQKEVTYAQLDMDNPSCKKTDTVDAAIYTSTGGNYGNKRVYLIRITPYMKNMKIALSLSRIDHDVQVRGYAEYPASFDAVDSSAIVTNNLESISALACNEYVLSVGSYTTYDGTYTGYLSQQLIPQRQDEQFNRVTTFSSYGYDWNGMYHPDVLCPGVLIESYFNAYDTTVYRNSQVVNVDVTIFQNRSILGVASGTSMASPHMAGVVALLLQNNPQLTTSDIRAYLKASNQQLPDSTLQSRSGRLDAIALANQAGIDLQGPHTSLPSVTETASPTLQKRICHGELLIIRDGKIYNALGIRKE